MDITRRPRLPPSPERVHSSISDQEVIRFLWAATKGYRLRPWRSPYLRWRIETYWGLHAEQITFRSFWRFVWQQRGDLWRYARWARRLRRRQHLGAAPESACPVPAKLV